MTVIDALDETDGMARMRALDPDFEFSEANAATVTDVVIAIVELRAEVRTLGTSIIRIAEDGRRCDDDHEMRLRTAEAAMRAIDQIAVVAAMAMSSRDRLDVLEKQRERRLGWKDAVTFIGGAAAGAIGIGIAVFAAIRGAVL